jgi:hypothetical protein
MFKLCKTAGCLLVVAAVAGAMLSSIDARGQDKPDEKAMMATLQKSMTPAKEHEALAKQVGSWNVEMVDHMAGEQKSQATAEIKMLMGGRYQEIRIKGTMMGQSFEGCSTTGFDTLRNVYVNTWIDNMGTNITTAEGKAIDDKTVEMKGQMVDPSTGKMLDFRNVTTTIDADHFTFEIYFRIHGQEKKIMSSNYSRVK